MSEKHQHSWYPEEDVSEEAWVQEYWCDCGAHKTILCAEYEGAHAGFGALGRPGKSSERVAEEAAVLPAQLRQGETRRLDPRRGVLLGPAGAGRPP